MNRGIEQDQGASSATLPTALSSGCAGSSPVPGLAADALQSPGAVTIRVLQWPLDHGYLHMTFPSLLSVAEVDEIDQVMAITLRGMRSTAQAIEARRAAAAKTDAVEDESAVAESDAPKGEGQ